MSTELDRPAAATLAVMSDDEIRRTYRISEALAASGMFPDARRAEEAFAKILLGRDLGLNPTQAMTGIYIVEGKPQVAAVMLAAFVKRGGIYDYRVLEHTPETCSIEFRLLLDGGEHEVLGVSTFTIAEAQAAGLVKDRSGWAKYPRNMLYARAMSNGVKWFTPDATHGIPVYHEGEIVSTAELLTEGEGDGEAKGIDLGPKVETVIARAQALGHVGIADRATVEMILGGRGPDVVAKWCRDASVTLDQFEASGADGDAPTDAEVVEPVVEL